MKKINKNSNSYLKNNSSVKINIKNLDSNSKNLKKPLKANNKVNKAKNLKSSAPYPFKPGPFIHSYEERYDSYGDRISHAIALGIVAPYNPDEL